jgi:FG-GAP-like repeat
LKANGHKDLVAVTAAGETLVFLGNGKGSFTREKTPPPAFPGACRGAHVELADLDGDGRDEMVESFSNEPDLYGHCPVQRWSDRVEGLASEERASTITSFRSVPVLQGPLAITEAPKR